VEEAAHAECPTPLSQDSDEEDEREDFSSVSTLQFNSRTSTWADLVNGSGHDQDSSNTAATTSATASFHRLSSFDGVSAREFESEENIIPVDKQLIVAVDQTMSAEDQLAELARKAVRLRGVKNEISDARKEMRGLQDKVAKLQDEARELSRTLEGQDASGFQWEHQVSDTEWNEMTGDVEGILTRAYAKHVYGGPAEILCKVGIEEYSFDLAKMTQTNVKTKEVRLIRCVLDVPGLCCRVLKRRSKDLADQRGTDADPEDQSNQKIYRPNTAATNKFYKTKFCTFHAQGKCMHGTDCSYAHDESELRKFPEAQPQPWLAYSG
jgi:TolA-binding protein